MRQDIESTIKKFKVTTFGNKKAFITIDKNLKDDETVLYIAPTNAVITTVGSRKVQKLPGVFAITSSRILFVYSVALSFSMFSHNATELKSVNCSGNSLTGGHILIQTLVQDYDFLVSYKKQVIMEVQDILNQLISSISNARPAVISIPVQDDAAQIEKLHELMQKGILTPEEFETKKRQILGV